MAGMSAVEGLARVPEARYSYYRRCQVFRHNGDQCKAPAERGSQICYAHAGQQAMAFRRDLERRVVLAEAVAEMRRQGHTESELENLLMDFKGISGNAGSDGAGDHSWQDRLQNSGTAGTAFADDVKAVVDALQQQNLTADKR